MNAPDHVNLGAAMSVPASSPGVAPAVLELERLSVSFGGFRAVDGVTLSIEPSELRVIIGPNGAGKTTLLDMICGKTKPSAGRIVFNGHDIVGLPEHRIVRAGIGRKFQTPSVYEDLSVIENLEISVPGGRGMWGSMLFRRNDRVMHVVQQTSRDVFLDAHLDRKAGQLSHGQKQWLEIGMLLMQSPQLLLLDEPVAGMSPRERELTAELLTRVARGKSVVVIEHDMDFVKRIARKVTVLHQGKVLSEGSVDAVQSDPRVIDVYLGH